MSKTLTLTDEEFDVLYFVVCGYHGEGHTEHLKSMLGEDAPKIHNSICVKLKELGENKS